jgi:Sigma-70, region 4
MVPAQDDLDRLAYLLSGDQDHADALVRTTLRGDGDGTVAALVGEWLADPGTGYAPVAEPASLDTERLRRGLGELAPRQRAAVVLRFWSGLTVAATAELLDCPEPAVEYDTTAARDLLATSEEELATGLATIAADADPAPVDLAELAAEVRAGRRQRWRSVGVAAVVLVAAGVFAAVLGLGDPGTDTPADAGWSPPPTVPSTFTPVPGEPVLTDPAPSFDNRSRRLTAQLAAARARLLPAGTDLEPAAVSSPAGDVLWAPLVFHVSDTPDLYLAMATLGSGHDATVLKLDVGYRDPDADPRFTPCPEFQLDCTYRRFPDGTYGAVTVFSEPVADQTIRRLTVMRPDGTFLHVAVFFRERRADPPPLDRDALFRFATVLNY